MKALYNYLKEVAFAFVSLANGLLLTLKYFVTPWKSIITENYPDNRANPSVADEFAGEVILIHDENNEHKCTACTLCQLACPNNSIQIISKQEETEDGKKKKVLDKWVYHLETCTFCKLCIDACPQDAIKMTNSYELSCFDRSTLTKILNQPGSKLKEKPKVTAKVQE